LVINASARLTARPQNYFVPVRCVTNDRKAANYTMIQPRAPARTGSEKRLTMAILRLLRTETFRLVAFGFALGSVGIALNQPAQAQNGTPVEIAGGFEIARL
jgi:hypothetical protein